MTYESGKVASSESGRRYLGDVCDREILGSEKLKGSCFASKVIEPTISMESGRRITTP